MVRCDSCQTEFIINETKYEKWLSLYNFIEFLYFENYIEERTRNEMIGSLMVLKSFSFKEVENLRE